MNGLMVKFILKALAPISLDEKFYKKLVPGIA